ncbi:MAG: DUF2189 domain-containing protein [Burkholderiales bacterium]|nr:DUF2189 domain-containing protein [Burkholderiales bacterium]
MSDPPPLVSPQGAAWELREIPAFAPFAWLVRGWDDFRAAPLASGFYGAAFAAMGWALAALYDFAYQYVTTLAGAFLLAAPFLATGLYALSRDRERGLRPRLAPSLTAWRENVGGLGIYVLVVTVIFLVWARASLVTFALFSTGTMPDLKGFLAKAFSLGNIEFVLVYFAAGSVFATLVFAVSVVSVPMMLDRGNDAVSAAILSVQVLAKNPGTMAVWAALIVVLTGLGLATAFLGLVLTMPVIGHATWHAYRDCVAWGAAGGGDEAGGAPA